MTGILKFKRMKAWKWQRSPSSYEALEIGRFACLAVSIGGGAERKHDELEKLCCSVLGIEITSSLLSGPAIDSCSRNGFLDCWGQPHFCGDNHIFCVQFSSDCCFEMRTDGCAAVAPQSPVLAPLSGGFPNSWSGLGTDIFQIKSKNQIKNCWVNEI